ncbi:MAG: Gp15 family bacteriophage protein [Anaerostipes hadrus]
MVSSFAEQYGIRIYSKEFKEMQWHEFKALLCGIGPDTAFRTDRIHPIRR